MKAILAKAEQQKKSQECQEQKVDKVAQKTLEKKHHGDAENVFAIQNVTSEDLKETAVVKQIERDVKARFDQHCKEHGLLQEPLKMDPPKEKIVATQPQEMKTTQLEPLRPQMQRPEFEHHDDANFEAKQPLPNLSTAIVVQNPKTTIGVKMFVAIGCGFFISALVASVYTILTVTGNI